MDYSGVTYYPNKDMDIYGNGRSADDSLQSESDASTYNDPTSKKSQKKTLKKENEQRQRMLLTMPFLMFAGAGRLLLTVDKKRKIIKVAQM